MAWPYDDTDAKLNQTSNDLNGNPLKNGDSVQLTKDLNVKGSSLNLKRGTTIKNIKLTDNEEEVECRIGKSTIILRTEFLKKKRGK